MRDPGSDADSHRDSSALRYRPSGRGTAGPTRRRTGTPTSGPTASTVSGQGATDFRDLAERDPLTAAIEQVTESVVITDLRAGDTPEATAQAICGRVVNLTGVVGSQLSLFGLDGRCWPIGFVVEGQPDTRCPSGGSLPVRPGSARGSPTA
jgi:hypothetical protein